MFYNTINPANDSILREFRSHTTDEINKIIGFTDVAFESWRFTSFDERKSKMLRLSELLLSKKLNLATSMAYEMGKPISAGIAEIEKCAWVCEFYANETENILKDEHIETARTKSYVTFNPTGVILAVMPWNFPFWQVFRFAAPNLMCGNAILLKHAPNVSSCATEIVNLIREAGFPENIMSIIYASPELVPDTVQTIISNRKIRGVTLTGSGRAGSEIAAIAGKNLKKSVLELGGSDAYLILKDAEIEKAAKSCAISRMSNSGQTCIAAKRFIVDRVILDEFLNQFIKECKKFVPGSPILPETNMGPLARKDLRDTMHNQVLSSVKQGAEMVLGGSIEDEVGCFYPPTILTEITQDMTAFIEEIFGPVASVIAFNTESEAVKLANATNYGLGAAIFTQDKDRGEFLAANMLEAGSCFVNEFVKSDPRLPFGGIKESGYGRELTKYGLTEFINVKTVVVE